jgi:fumarylacetoacetate (FAA) hydrolase
MKLATYSDGSRDGQLIVVSRDLASAHYANGIATRLQQVLDDWNFLAPQLEALYGQLNQGRLRHAFGFEPGRCMAPLPRSFHWCEWASAGERAGRQRVGGWVQPAQGSLQALGVREGDGDVKFQLRLGLAVVTGDVAQGLGAREAVEAVRLLMCAQRWAGDDADPVADPTVFCAPVAITPDELGPAWRGGRVQPAADAGHVIEVHWRIDGRRAPAREAALPRRWPQDTHFGELIAETARTRPLAAGTVLAWYGALDAEAPLPAQGQRVRSELWGPGGLSLFGAIEPTWGAAGAAAFEAPILSSGE